jgi:hypothetical protein
MPTSQQVIRPKLRLISWQMQVQVCGLIYSVHVLHISLILMFVVHRYKSIVTKLPLHIAYIHTVSILQHACKHGICDRMFGRMHTFYAIQHISNIKVQIMKLYEVHVLVKCTANRSILMTCVEVAFIFSSFRLNFLMQHSLFAWGREMRSFFLRRTFYQVLRASLTNLALPCPGPS